VSKTHFEPLDVNTVEVATFSMALKALQMVFDANLLCLVFQDRQGQVFVHARPGFEPHIMRTLGTMDWDVAARVAEEHCV